jgi:hypothetical protein
VVEDEGAEALVNFLKHEDIQPAMLHDVGHAWRVAGQGADPLLTFDGILLILGAEELGNGDQPVVAELEAVPRYLPRVHGGVVGRDDRELVVEEPRVDEREVVIHPEVVDPHVELKEDVTEVLQQTLLGLQRVRFLIVEDGHHPRPALADLLETYTQDHTEVGGQVRCFDVPSEDTTSRNLR